MHPPLRSSQPNNMTSFDLKVFLCDAGFNHTIFSLIASAVEVKKGEGGKVISQITSTKIIHRTNFYREPNKTQILDLVELMPKGLRIEVVPAELSIEEITDHVFSQNCAH